MCRMLGIVARSGIDISLLRDFRALAKEGLLKDGTRGEHPTGWGVVYFEGKVPKYAGRRPQSAWKDDEEYEKACQKLEEIRPRIVVTHLRKAPQASCSLKNTHPFVKEGWGFAHNGTIHYNQEQLEGRIDSEKFFADILEEVKNGESVASAIKTARQVASESKDEQGKGYSSLTFLMANATNLYAYREYTTAPKYYGMFYTVMPDIAIATQETEWLSKKIPGANWRELMNRGLVSIDAENIKTKWVNIK